jgi:HTH-type transcriptional regulator/antitoxin HipB
MGEAIRRRRKQLALTQGVLGEKTGLRQATVSDLERGVSRAQLHTLFDVLTALGLEVVVRERSSVSPKDIEDLF